MKIPTENLFSSTVLVSCPMSSIRAIKVDLLSLKPYWLSTNKLCFSTKQCSLATKSYSNIFENWDKSEIGLLFVYNFCHHPLTMELLLPFSFCEGSSPVQKTCVRGATIAEIVSLTMNISIPFQSVDFLLKTWMHACVFKKAASTKLGLVVLYWSI